MVKEGPDYVCTCCHRLMYRKTVVEFKPTKYSKLSDDFMRTVFPPEIVYTSAQQKVWICKTCDNTLKRGRMPAQAKVNNLTLEDVPVRSESNGDPTHLSADPLHEDGCTPVWQAARDSWTGSECSHRPATCV